MPRRTLKKLRNLAKRSDIDLWFEDECHFQQHGSRCTMWVPPEDMDPIILHASTRKSVAFFGAVCVEDGRFTVMRAKTFNTNAFQAFLSRLLQRRRPGRRIILIVDNARWHHAKRLKPWLHEHRHVLKLVFLPPYSPELNAIERVWKLTRRLCTHNRYFASLDELIHVVEDQFARWQHANDTLRRLCAVI